MASRILVAVVGIPLLLVILLLCPPICMALVVALLSAIGAYELTGATGALERRALVVPTCALALLTPFWFYLGCNIYAAMGGGLLFLLVVFSVAFASHETVTLGQIGTAVMAGAVIPGMFSAMLLLTEMAYYRIFVLLPFVSAFCSDGAALFVGMQFGKRKLAPVLSPHKTVEGSIGGVLGSVAACLAYGCLILFCSSLRPNLVVFAVYGLLGSAVSQFGDLAFSYIKREFGLKDYGHLFLAHGGVLDRFDSVIFCAPLTAVLAHVLPFLAL